ncbi:MAG: PIN domain-containing protein [Alphaproteobacteria bacterium]|nr:MAG: PIN domain-containing protein [Alphaproteobacteria bacterium]
MAALSKGRRKEALAAAAELMFQEDLACRILPFDGDGAVHYTKLVMARRNAGAPIETFDALIAATTLAAGAGIATRDMGGFAGCGLSVVNPWEAA